MSDFIQASLPLLLIPGVKNVEIPKRLRALFSALASGNGLPVFSFQMLGFVISSLVLKIAFDLICVFCSSTIVRKKVFKPYITKRLSIIMVFLLSFTASNCPEDHIHHNTNHGPLCCKSTICKPGNYVKTCTRNMTDDTCAPCPHGHHLLDSTNSSQPFPCVKFRCPPETLYTGIFPRRGCRIPCECNRRKGYMGPDPCACLKIPQKLQKNIPDSVHVADRRGRVFGPDIPPDIGFNNHPDKIHPGNSHHNLIKNGNSHHYVMPVVASGIVIILVVAVVFIFRKKLKRTLEGIHLWCRERGMPHTLMDNSSTDSDL